MATSESTEGLLSQLTVQSAGEREWTAACLSGRSGRVFGGQMLAQGLMAAAADLNPAGPGRTHSLHAQFLRAALPTTEIRYCTTPLRRSTRFATTRVDLTQAADMVATLSVSAHRGEVTPSHSASPPTVVGSPEDAPLASGSPIPSVDSPIRHPFDLRAARLQGIQGSDGRPQVGWWVRLREPLPNAVANAAALAWASDFALTHVADVEHEHLPGERQAASLDHAMWFHRLVDLSRWHLYVLTSPVYQRGLALSSGQFYNQDGLLVATVVQESLLRRVTRDESTAITASGPLTAFQPIDSLVLHHDADRISHAP
jgi:acyl-CoA thioesterase-2